MVVQVDYLNKRPLLWLPMPQHLNWISVPSGVRKSLHDHTGEISTMSASGKWNKATRHKIIQETNSDDRALANQSQRPRVQSYVLKSQAKSLADGIYLFILLIDEARFKFAFRQRSTQLPLLQLCCGSIPNYQKRNEKKMASQNNQQRNSACMLWNGRYASPCMMPTPHARNLLQSQILFCTGERNRITPGLSCQHDKLKCYITC